MTVVVGGQYGGEGKGKTTAYLSASELPDIVVRCGGPNSGHTVELEEKTHILRQVPAGFVSPRTRLLVAPGAIIDPDILRTEMDVLSLEPDRLGIDRNAGVVTEGDRKTELDWDLGRRIGSTGTGMGAAVTRRSGRTPDFRRVQDVPKFRPWVTDVAKEVNEAIDRGGSVIVEGTQGFGLSLLHSPYFPYVTSRDTTAAAFLSEVGLSPVHVRRIVMVLRTFPIRVGGNSGPLTQEVSWDHVQSLSGSPNPVKEYTTVTSTLRRVGKFDEELVRRAAVVNRPTHIVVNGLDLIDYRNRQAQTPSDLTPPASKFLAMVGNITEGDLMLAGVGPRLTDFVPLQSDLRRLLEVAYP